MNEHDAIRELLPLAAAETLDEKEQRRLEQHLLSCPDCSAELDQWRALGHGLRRLPTPQATAVLLERTRQQMRAQLADAAERSANPWVMGFLVLLSWTFALATWPIVRFLTAGALGWLDMSFRSAWLGLVGYTMLGWIVAAVAAIFLDRRPAGRRTA